MTEYTVFISQNGRVKEKKDFRSLTMAKEWAESCEEVEYTVSIFKDSDDRPFIKYTKKSLF